MKQTASVHGHNLRRAAHKQRVRVRVVVWLLLLLNSWGQTYASDIKPESIYRVLVLLSQQTVVYQQVVEGMRTGMGDNSRVALQTTSMADYAKTSGALSQMQRADLIITVGTEAAQAVLQKPSNTPLCMILIPRATSEALVREYEQTPATTRRQITAVYIDQPFQRQLRLIRLTLPHSRSLGVVYGPLSRDSEKQLKIAAENEKWQLHTVSVNRENELFSAFTQVLDDSDVLLALPDPLVYNQHTTQNILLETYRQRKPLIGYSHAYVQAGALAAVYSTPLQIGRQVGEHLLDLGEKNGINLPTARYPKYFTVEVNQQVAHSLGLTIAAATELQTMIEATQER